MKIKQGLLVIILNTFGICSFAFGQWVKSATEDIYYAESNIGIGITKPEATLHVKNSLLVTSITPLGVPGVPSKETSSMITLNCKKLVAGTSTTTTAEGTIKVSHPSKNFVLNAVSPLMPIVFQTQNSERLRISPNGNIGIGTTTPNRSLTIANTLGLNYMNVKDGTREILMGADDNGGIISVMSKHDLILRAGENDEKMRITAGGNIGIGTTNPGSKLDVNGTTTTKVLKITGGSDLSEQFDITSNIGHEGFKIEPGTVVGIDSANPGNLIISNKPYDRRVAGIISGAGGVASGMLMGQSGTAADGKYPVALTGRVYCKADATSGEIQPGDLLTTSDMPGHAMRVSDYEKAQGAIIGKAMTSLDEGQGLVLVLVSLQ